MLDAALEMWGKHDAIGVIRVLNLVILTLGINELGFGACLWK